MYFNERHPLFLRCFKTFLRCICHIGGASNSTCLPKMGIMHISAKVYSQIVNNISDVWYPPHTTIGDAILYGKVTIDGEVFESLS